MGFETSMSLLLQHYLNVLSVHCLQYLLSKGFIVEAINVVKGDNSTLTLIESVFPETLRSA